MKDWRIQRFLSNATLFCVVVFCCAHAKQINVPGEGVTNPKSALEKAQIGDTIFVSDGIYHGNFVIPTGVIFKAKNNLKAILDGSGRGKVVTIKNGSVIDGFQITTGTIGIYSASPGGAIRKCRIAKMTQSGIMCLGQLPVIEDNVIAFNNGSGIQGWDAQSSLASVNHNTIAYNENNGITLGGNSKATIENNIIAFNRRSGVKKDEKTQVTLLKNDFFGNANDDQVAIGDNISVDPQFIIPYQLDFKQQSTSKCLGAAADGSVLGARLSIDAVGK